LVLGGCAETRIPKPDLPEDLLEFVPPEPEQFKLSNGMEVIFMHDPELPLVSGTLYIPGGALWEDLNTPGVIGALGSQMRAGGTKNISADDLDYRMEELSASIGSSFGNEYGSISFEALSADFDEIFSLFSQVVLEPQFENSRLELWKAQRIEGIKRRRDDPSAVASIAFQELVYGRQTHFGQITTSSDVEKIKRLHLLRAHRELVRPDRGILVVTGDISKEKVESVAEKFFGEVKRSEPLDPPPTFDYTPTPGIYFIEFPLQQATIQIGQPGPLRHSPDEPAIAIFNDIFGAGGFNSRLLRRVRTDLGLAYWIGGGISPGFAVGRNSISAQTKSESAAQTIEEALAILTDMRESPPFQQELQLARQALQGSFVFRFDSKPKVAHRKALLPLMGYPEDYDDNYLERIQSINPNDVLAVAKRYWDLDQLVIVVVGNQSSYTVLQEAIATVGSPLYGMSIRKVGFDEQVVLN